MTVSSLIERDVTVCPGTTLYDDYAHRPFICSNEGGHKYIVQQASQLPLKGNTIVGVSCFAVLNIAARRPIPLKDLSVVIIDRGVRVLDFWHKVIQLIKNAEDREEFQDDLISLYFEHKPTWGEGLKSHDAYRETMDQLGVEIQQGISWLAEDKTFSKVKQVVEMSELKIYGGDITKNRDMEFLNSELSRLGKRVDLFYISNCHEYIKPTCEALQSYTDSISTLCRGNRSYILTTLPRASIQEPLQQRIVEYQSRNALSTFWHRDECRTDRYSPVDSEECFYFSTISSLLKN